MVGVVVRTMTDGLLDTAFGSVLVAAGVLIAWFAATWSAPFLGILGAVYVVVGAAAALVHLYLPSGTHERVPTGIEATASVSLSSAPEFVRDDLPPSSKLVWLYLAARGESTLDDIVRGTQLTPRTARNAITRLERYEAVSKRPSDRNARTLSYDVRTPNEDVTADASDQQRSPAGA